jgi:hypothetical protein
MSHQPPAIITGVIRATVHTCERRTCRVEAVEQYRVIQSGRCLGGKDIQFAWAEPRPITCFSMLADDLEGWDGPQSGTPWAYAIPPFIVAMSARPIDAARSLSMGDTLLRLN